MIPGDIEILNTVILPALIPQVSDPRIIIQSFNPPHETLIPPNINPPAMKFNITLPKIHHVSQAYLKQKLHIHGKLFIINKNKSILKFFKSN